MGSGAAPTTGAKPSPRHHSKKDDGDGDDASSASGAAAVLAGLTRSLVFAVKGSLPKGIAKTVFRKRAFLTIGSRTASAATMTDHIVTDEATPSTTKPKSSPKFVKAVGRCENVCIVT